MLNELLWFIAGAISSLLINFVTEATFPSLLRKYKSYILKRRAKRPLSIPAARKLSVGGFNIDWIILANAKYTQERIRCSYSDKKIPLVPEFELMKREFILDWKKKMAKGETHLPYNSPTYKLKSFDVGYREIIDGEEVAVLVLNFVPTDYFTQLITDLNINNPVREAYAAVIDITSQPVPEFSSIVGININLITKDGYLIITDRHARMPVGAGKLHTSVAEGLLRPTDAGSKGAPDPFRCAMRGAQEEMGIVLNPKELEFTAFGVQPVFCQYSLIGWSRINETKEDIEDLYSFAIPKDKWENRKLYFVPCNPSSIAQFVVEHKNSWVPIGVAAVLLSLFQMDYDKKDIEQAFFLALSKMPN